MKPKSVLAVGLLATVLAVGVIGFAPWAAAAGGGGGSAVGVQSVSATVPMWEEASVDVETSGCDNSPGPYVTLTGEIALGGLGVQLIFQNNERGTHTHVEETTASVIVIPAGESLTIPKQPVLGGAGGNPFIWIQFTDAGGNALSSEIFLGRCVQGLFAADADWIVPALATATVEGGSCDNTGSTISLSGELRLTGINANLIFRNNDNPVGGPHKNTQPTTVSIVLIPAGETIEFPKQPPLGGVGGNPWIYLQFINAAGESISDRFLLGRCVQDF
jgi:hypothetical protein